MTMMNVDAMNDHEYDLNMNVDAMNDHEYDLNINVG